MLIRQANPDDSARIAEVHVNTWRTTYPGIVSDEVLDGLSVENRQRMWDATLTTHRDDNYVYVVEQEDGHIVGFAWAGKEREGEPGHGGEIYAIYLLEEHQGKGWGKQLFLAITERLSREGFDSMILWVLADNPTRGFYEAMGGRIMREKEIEIGEDMLIEVAYAWEPIEDLLAEYPS